MAQLLMRRPHLRDLPGERPLPEGYALRALREGDDLAALAETLTGAFGEVWTEDTVRERLLGDPTVRAVYVALHGGRAAATASSRLLPDRYPGSGYVHWVGTHPDHLRRGLGAALMARVLADFAERGYTDAVLETDDFRLPAIRTYLRFGFVPVYAVEGEDHTARWSAVFRELLQETGAQAAVPYSSGQKG
jgi:mycothiol synthase